MATEEASVTRMPLSVVTPTGRAAETTIDEITAPGAIGEFGVLPGHVPFLAALKAGVLTWKDQSGRHLLAVDKGYLEVGVGNRLIVLVEKALRPEAIDVEAARVAAAQASAALKAGIDDTVRAAMTQLDLEWAEAQVEAHNRSHGKGAAAQH